MTKEIDYLSKRLSYTFKERSLLVAALTHRSVRGHNNERLEFLGDSILNFIIAEGLFHRYPKAKEGELSRLRAMLVKGETLATLANEFFLGDYLRLGVGELKSGGAQRESILADALEAIIGAIYLDAGFEECKQRVLGWYESRLQALSPSKMLKDPKTRLQELLQAKKYPLPSYDILKIEGEAHEQTFYVVCHVEGFVKDTQGKGRSRRKAEQEAAKKFLMLLEDYD